MQAVVITGSPGLRFCIAGRPRESKMKRTVRSGHASYSCSICAPRGGGAKASEGGETRSEGQLGAETAREGGRDRACPSMAMASLAEVRARMK